MRTWAQYLIERCPYSARHPARVRPRRRRQERGGAERAAASGAVLAFFLSGQAHAAYSFDLIGESTSHETGSLVVALIVTMVACLGMLSLWVSQRKILRNSDAAAKELVELRERESGLRLQIEHITLATGSAGIGLWQWDALRNKLVWNEEMFRLHGIRAEDFSGSYEAWTRAVHPDDLEHLNAEIEAAKKRPGEFAAEFRAKWPDGTVHNLHAKAKATRDPGVTFCR